MNVKLLAHTKLSHEFLRDLPDASCADLLTGVWGQRAAIALTAIRTCYSPLKPTEIVAQEGEKYFGNAASDGEGGTEADRLFRHITGSGHTSTLEHITYTFAVEGVSRALLAQLTRHRHLSFSVQSQRYVRLGSTDKSGGFDSVFPPSIEGNPEAKRRFRGMMINAQEDYDTLRSLGVPAEDARMVLPNAAACNLVMTGNLRTLLDFYAKRRPGRGAQWEIADLAVRLRDEIVKVDPWLAPYFDTKENA